MSSSIPHSAIGPRGLDEAENARARVQRDDLLDLLRTICDALDVPSGVPQQGLRDDRIRLVHNTVRNVLDGTAVLGIAWETELLRQETADDSPRAAIGQTQVIARRSPVRALWLRCFPKAGGRHA